jgi:hypothetical protein
MFKLLTILAQTHVVGSVGCIVRLSIFVAAIQGVSVMRLPICRRLSMRLMNVPCGRSRRQTLNLPTDCFSVSSSLPGRCVSKNWPSFSHLISKRDGFRNFERIGAWKIP